VLLEEGKKEGRKEGRKGRASSVVQRHSQESHTELMRLTLTTLCWVQSRVKVNRVNRVVLSSTHEPPCPGKVCSLTCSVFSTVLSLTVDHCKTPHPSPLCLGTPSSLQVPQVDGRGSPSENQDKDSPECQSPGT
jgi:hypothetical protein